MKILVGVDFSKSSEKAIEHAAIWARKFIAEVVLVHTYLPVMVDPNIPVGSIEVLQLDHINELNEKLEAQTRKLREGGVSAKYKVVVGDIKSGILQTAKEEEADLIILGKTKNPNFLEKLLGSNAQHLVNATNVPLLIIPENSQAKDLSNIAYATEIEFEESDLINKMVVIADRFKAKLHLFRVLVANAMFNDISEVEKEKFLNKSNSSITRIEEIEAESLRQGISKYTEKQASDLLVLVSHKRGVLDGLLAPSKSKMLIPKIDIPILIYHFT